MTVSRFLSTLTESKSLPGLCVEMVRVVGERICRRASFRAQGLLLCFPGSVV